MNTIMTTLDDSHQRISAHIDPYVTQHRYSTVSRGNTTWILRRFATSAGDPRPGELGFDHIEAWWGGIAHLAPSTLRQNHSQVKCFLGYLRARGLIAGDPLATIGLPKQPRSSPKTFTPDEVDRLRHACTTSRDRVIIELARAMGLRCVEISRIHLGDLDLERGFLDVQGKGGNEDPLPIPQRVIWAIELYIGEHAEQLSVAGPLLRARNGRSPIPPHRISQIGGAVIARAGVKRAAFDGRTMHGLRRTCATAMLDAGVHIRDVQGTMRHTDLSSTQRYLRRSDANDLRQALERGLADGGEAEDLRTAIERVLDQEDADDLADLRAALKAVLDDGTEDAA